MDLPKPDIRPEVNKEEKKSSGFWSSLFSFLSRNPVVMEGGEDAAADAASAASGAEASGAAGAGEGLLQSLSRLGFGSGILATKAGVIALALAGGSLAGGVGYMGYKAMHSAPGAAGAHSFWPFAAPPASSAGAAGASGQASGAGAAGGAGAQAEDSLASLRAANPAAARGALARNAAGAKAGAAAARAAAAGGSSGAAGTAGGAGSARGIPSLNDNGFKSGDWRIGGGGGGTFAASKGAPSAGRKAASVGAFEQSRSLSGISKSGLEGAGASKLGGGAAGELGQVNREMNGSYGGGTSRYDSKGGNTGTPIGLASNGTSTGGTGTGGSGSGSGATGSPTNGGSNNQQFNAPPTPTAGSSAAPWKGMLQMGMLLAFAAAVLIFIAHKMITKTNPTSWMATFLAGIAALLGIAEVVVGSSIGGQGQQAIGSMLTLSGGLLAASAISMAFISRGDDPGGVLKYIVKFAGAAGIMAAMGAYMQSGAMSGSGGLGGFASVTPPSAHVVVVEAAPSERIG